MKKLLIFSFILLLFAFHTPYSTNSSISILVVTGGQEFEKEPFFAMFDGFQSIKYETVVQPKANSLWGSKKIKDYDAIVFYDLSPKIENQYKKDFIKMLKKGKGVVFLHQSLQSYQNWGDYKFLIGGKYHKEPFFQFGKEVKSITKPNMKYKVQIVNPSHPITSGMEAFEMEGEMYGGCEILPNVTPLLLTMHPESMHYLGWTHEFGKSKIVYLQPGKDTSVFNNPNYKKILEQAIEWTASGN
ncbi:ThuA domain-containing protein [Flammeovirgaceae bacterium SG7u.111]|nr:ThuA domain-containing protein [Flammeovirgaceae bacterium SG7u.132]WPO38031.1 ThuA domain-containing protein [Flammeovirgaceae bacterium SG7u.111]